MHELKDLMRELEDLKNGEEEGCSDDREFFRTVQMVILCATLVVLAIVAGMTLVNLPWDVILR